MENPQTPTNNPAPTSGHWPCTNAEYHGDRTRVSHSSLEVFANSAPLFFQKYISGVAKPMEPTPAMQLGTLVHALILEPETINDEFVLMPEINKRTNAGKAEYETFVLANQGKTVVELEAWEKAHAIAAEVEEHDAAQSLLSLPGQNEYTICWEHEGTGIPCKTRMDGWRPGSNIILDVKTSVNPSPEDWHKQAHNMGYHRQVGFYKMAAAMGLKVPELPRFIFLVVGNTAPHEVVVYELAPDFEELGYQETENQLRDLEDRKTRNDWNGRHSQGIHILGAPKWAFANFNPIKGEASLSSSERIATKSSGLVARA